MNAFFNSGMEPDTLLSLTSNIVFKEVLDQEKASS